MIIIIKKIKDIVDLAVRISLIRFHKGMEIVMKISDSASFGQALRKKRKEMGLTQSYLSDFTGFSVSFISDLERGKKTAELGKAIDMANILGLDIEIVSRGGDDL